MREQQKNILLCLFSAILLILSFPKPNLGFLAWFALVPWFFAIRKKTPLEAFLLSYLIGLLFFSGVIYWVTYVTGLGFTLLVFYLAFYFAIFGLVFSTVNCQLSTVNCFIIPCVWVALEYIRSHLFTGFGWALLGYSQYLALPIIQISDITGAYGVSFLIVLVNVGVCRFLSTSLRAKRSNPFLRLRSLLRANVVSEAIPAASLLRRFAPRNRQKSNHRASRNDSASPIYWALCPLLFVILVLSYGYYKLNQPTEGQSIKVAVIQGNIPQKMKWDPQAREYILEKYSHLTKQAALSQPQLIVWPETSVPGYLESDAQLLREVRALSKKISPAELLAGTPHSGACKSSLRAKRSNPLLRLLRRHKGKRQSPRNDDGKGLLAMTNKTCQYNSASLLSQGKVTRRYDKLHLVPFGEFMPWPAFFSRFSFAGLIGDFTPGEDYTVFTLSQTKPKINFSALICFEDTLGDLARKFVQKGAQILVNMTNDAWFGDSSELEQHLQASVFRAVENRVNVARSANTGVSCFISPRGKILSRTSEHLTQNLQIVPISSFYTAFGDIFARLCLLVSAFFCVYLTCIKLQLTRQSLWDIIGSLLHR